MARALRSTFDPAHHVWVRWLARFGYLARGIVYLLIGGLTVYAAISARDAIGKRQALQELSEHWLGVAVLVAVVIGMGGYIVWRLVQSIGDTDDHGTKPKGLAVRGGLLVSALTYSALLWYCVTLLFFGETEGRGGAINDSRGIMERAAAYAWIALAIGIAFWVVAGAHWWKALKRKYERHILADEGKMRWIHPVSRLGLSARGVVLAVIGSLFVYRWWTSRDETGDPPDLRDALRFVEDLPAGAWLLGALGVGLILFAGYSITEAVFRRINVHEASSPVGDDGMVGNDGTVGDVG